ncbi:juxtaposed with another zinc finger protein 1-like isoform X1 [Brevipalpus obovatus]|uniref:juxtaposed with another zinc finger protein 1-like isoform X1 n=1 Tax=Brevipalpus obovatus TaxID=246614 RepID=UPI003D9E7CAC
MAVFFVNTCKFNSCGITFATLQELIRHIEETHLNFDPQAMEEQILKHPASLPISYVLRFFDGPKKEASSTINTYSHLNQLKTKSGRSHSPALSITSTTPTGSEMDDENYLSESEDSWSNVSNEGDSNLLRLMNGASSTNEEQDKPYPCVVNGCKKRYRNPNGLKYHIKNAHPSANFPFKRESQEPIKLFKCECGKNYKTPYGLKNHVQNQHSNQPSGCGLDQNTKSYSASSKLQNNATSVSVNVIPVRQSTTTTPTSSITPNVHQISSVSSTKTSIGALNVSNVPPPPALKEKKVSDKTDQLRGHAVIREEDMTVFPTETIVEMQVTQSSNSSSVAPTLQHHLLKSIIARAVPNQN